MLRNIKAVIFDLDGTLIDSMWLWKAIDIDYLSTKGLEFPETLQHEIEGMSFTETAHYFKKRFSLEDDIESIKTTWNEMALDYYLNRVTMKKGTAEFLNYLTKNNIKAGIGTSNSRELLQLIIHRFKLDEFIQSARTSCEVDKGKPHPDIFLKVAEDLGVHPDECLVFEDVPNGILAAKNAGMKVCGIYDDFSKRHQEHIRELADYYIQDFLEVIKTIEE